MTTRSFRLEKGKSWLDTLIVLAQSPGLRPPLFTRRHRQMMSSLPLHTSPRSGRAPPMRKHANLSLPVLD
ncbi:hypothetical protein JYU34_004925 [Plutella xylostella]|uniref:Uncharacterized protein n=1 Tax=Plutella xylostella TaxID=51655 RepID=A0ABQ7QVH1_PLUXY|nr:hypothetical protein JYU34_004925 [Plutella xylostella]